MMSRSSYRFGVSMLALFALAACGGGGGYGGGGGGSGGNGIVTNIVITPASMHLAAGGMQQYKAVSKDSGGNVINNAPLNWNSSDSSVAKVTSAGLVTAVADGSTTITASISYNSSGGIYGGGGPPTTYTSNKAALIVTGSSSVMGVAAVGRALGEAVITLKDSHGVTQTGMSDAEGHFLLSSAGMHAPFLIKAEDSQGHVLFSMRADEGVANVTPVTDLMARAWFAAHGSSVEAAFADPAAHPVPAAEDLAQLNGRFTEALATALASQGLDPEKFSFISTTFNADSTGADRVLDNLSVSTDHGKMLLDDRLGGQRIEVSLDTPMPALKVSAVLR